MTPTEINRRVAEACGLRVVHVEGDDWHDAVFANPATVCVIHENGTRDWYHSDEVCWYAGFSDAKEDFDPYHDANDALWAAERVGLFDWRNTGSNPNWRTRGVLGKVDGAWVVESINYAACQLDDEYSKSPTASAAICNAILALKGVPV